MITLTCIEDVSEEYCDENIFKEQINKNIKEALYKVCEKVNKSALKHMIKSGFVKDDEEIYKFFCKKIPEIFSDEGKKQISRTLGL